MVRLRTDAAAPVLTNSDPGGIYLTEDPSRRRIRRHELTRVRKGVVGWDPCQPEWARGSDFSCQWRFMMMTWALSLSPIRVMAMSVQVRIFKSCSLALG